MKTYDELSDEKQLDSGYDPLLKKFSILFEKMAFPVFYKYLYPTGKWSKSVDDSKEKDDLVNEYRFVQGLKNPNGNSKRDEYFEVFENQYKLILATLFKDIYASYPEKNVGIVVIPSSEPGYTNKVTWLVKKTLENPAFSSIDNLCGSLVRYKRKESAHGEGNRSIAKNEDSLSLQLQMKSFEDYDLIVVIDDVLTTGNSFTATNEFIQRIGGFSGPFINFAFSRAMNYQAVNELTNPTENEKNTDNEERKALLTGLVFDFDGTLVDESEQIKDENSLSQVNNFEERCNIYNEKIKSEHDSTKKWNKRKELLETHFTEHDVDYPTDLYKVFLGIDEIISKMIPFEIVTNSGSFRISAIMEEFPEILRALYPLIYNGQKNGIESCHKHETLKLLQGRPINGHNGKIFRPLVNGEKNIESNANKPCAYGVLDGIKKIKELWGEDAGKRVMGVGNTQEDLIAYKAAGIESILGLWGVPKYLKDYAKSKWKYDYCFDTVEDFSNALTLNGFKPWNNDESGVDSVDDDFPF